MVDLVKNMTNSHKHGKQKRFSFWIPRELLERFKAKVPAKRRSGYLRMCLELIEDDVKYMELQETLTEKQLEGLRHKIRMKKIEIEESYRKKEAFIT